MHSDPQLSQELIARQHDRRPLQAFGAVALIALVVFAIYWHTTAEMVSIWIRSETYTHGFVAIPVFLWFVWQRRDELARLDVAPLWPGIAALAGVGFVWLLGELSGSLAPSMFAMVAMVPALVTICLGPGWTRALLFPLVFLFFAVPFGDVFIPTLMDWTADLTVFGLQLSGVPVYREGQLLMIPSGNWSVVEACSGIRYVIASLFTGTLYAWTMYRSNFRRAMMLGASLLVPIVANWVRAYGIVMLGHLSNNRIATGVDHIIYGWIFFGVVMVALFWIGSRWREDLVPEQAPAHQVKSPQTAVAAQRFVSSRSAKIAVVALPVLLLWPLLRDPMMNNGDKRPLKAEPIAAGAGWRTVENPVSTYRPDLIQPVGELSQTFEKDGRRVTVLLSFYRDQRHGAELVTSTNQIVRTTNHQWNLARLDRTEVNLAGGKFKTNAAVLKSARQALLTWHWYWLGNISTTSDVRAKLEIAFDRLLMRGDTAAWVTLMVETGEDSRSAQATLADFVAGMGQPLLAALRTTAQR